AAGAADRIEEGVAVRIADPRLAKQVDPGLVIPEERMLVRDVVLDRVFHLVVAVTERASVRIEIGAVIVVGRRDRRGGRLLILDVLVSEAGVDIEAEVPLLVEVDDAHEAAAVPGIGQYEVTAVVE